MTDPRSSPPPEPTQSPVTATTVKEWVSACERQWRAELKGASLIAELDFDDDVLDRAESYLGRFLGANDPRKVAERFPAFLAVTLTMSGMRSWEEGTFYAKVADNLGVSRDTAIETTRWFHNCLLRLRLSTFEEAKGMRWVTPVLLHGAVPLDHLDELLDLIAARRRRDPSLTGETFVEWARLSPGKLAAQPKALVRFLQYGGDFAPDFVGRVMDFVAGQDVVLPRRVTSRLRQYLDEEPSRRGPAHREARATLGLAHDGTVVVRLPSVRPEQGRAVTWRVLLGDAVVKQDAEVPWEVGHALTEQAVVVVPGPVREVMVERGDARTPLPLVRKDDPLLVFDTDGELVRNTRPVPPGRVTLMWPDTVGGAVPLDANGQLLTGESEEPPYGWERWSVLKTSVPAGAAIRFGRHGAVHRVGGSDRASVVAAAALVGVVTRDGHGVVAEVPRVELPRDGDPADWTVSVRDAAGVVIEELRPASAQVDLLTSRTARCFGDLTVQVRGPLGRGVTRRIVVAEGVSVEATPAYRKLLPAGGLARARVLIRRPDAATVQHDLSSEVARLDVVVEGLSLRLEPEHPEFRLSSRDAEGVWQVEPLKLTHDDLVDGEIRLRGLPQGPARITFRSGGDQQELAGRGDRSGSPRFPLRAFRDLAGRAGSGTLMLETPDVTAPVATIRPPRLVSRLTSVGSVLDAEVLVSSPLQLVVFRLAAPWEPGVVLPLTGGRAELPANLQQRGDLRVLAWATDEWSDPPVDRFPRSGPDVFDLAQMWDEQTDHDEDRAVVRLLLREAPEASDPITAHTAARALDTLGLVSAEHALGLAEGALGRLLHDHPMQALGGVLTSHASVPAVTAALVSSGLVSSPPRRLAALDHVESLLARSPLAAVLAASAHVPNEASGELRALLTDTLGTDLETLWAGQPDDRRLGRLEPEFERNPDRVKHYHAYLDPVPGLMLDADTRIESSYQMWLERRRLAAAAKSALPTINVCRRVIAAKHVELWPMVAERLSHDGVIALPALSVALALVARIAAHGDPAAIRLATERRPLYGSLARHAPGLVAIDLVRADAALIGASR